MTFFIWLKQSPKAWFEKSSMDVGLYGYKQSNFYHTLFLKKRVKQRVSQSSMLRIWFLLKIKIDEDVKVHVA